MKKILIALSYHPVSEKIAKAGCQLAKALDAEVCLLHVINNLPDHTAEYESFMGYGGVSFADINFDSEIDEVARDFLDEVSQHIKDVKIEKHVERGPVAMRVLEYAESWKADIIVMGTHSHSFLEKIFIGSETKTVIEKTKIPIHLVPVKKD